MQAHNLYRRYRQDIERLVDRDLPRPAWLKELEEILQQLEREIITLEAKSASLLCDELAEQFEREALRAVAEHRRDVLLVALRIVQELSFRISK